MKSAHFGYWSFSKRNISHTNNLITSNYYAQSDPNAICLSKSCCVPRSILLISEFSAYLIHLEVFSYVLQKCSDYLKTFYLPWHALLSSIYSLYLNVFCLPRSPRSSRARLARPCCSTYPPARRSEYTLLRGRDSDYTHQLIYKLNTLERTNVTK